MEAILATKARSWESDILEDEPKEAPFFMLLPLTDWQINNKNLQ